MTPYVIINGVSSKQIEGLLIQSLPPISKPKMRIITEEIDGRDGDITTPIGYAAYDKPITIGLKGNYDVDDVISYFNQGGKITFSNEIDKYYQYMLYDRIDFNKLVRYKTATVNIHVQPFKYKEDEQPVIFKDDENTNPIIVSKKIINEGNTYSTPVYKVKGSGDIYFYLNGTKVLKIVVDGEEELTLDTQSMNLLTSDGIYYNRHAQGNYDDLYMKSGLNNLTITGSLKYVGISNYSRWL